MSVLHLAMHGASFLHSNYSGDTIISFQSIDQLKMSELVKEKFVAIDVAIKMLEKSPTKVTLHTSMNGIVEMNLNGGFKHKTTSPAFLWKEAKKGSYYYLVMDCREDFTLKYPIAKLTISIIDNKRSMNADVICNEQELLELLDEILYEV